MTAELLEYTSDSDVVVRRIRAAHSAASAVVEPRRPAAARAEERWVGTDVRSREVSRPPVVTYAAGPTSRLEWTPRGLAVMVVLVALIAGVMLSTLVGAFLSVSDEPIDVGASPTVLAMGVAQPGR